MTHLGIDAHIPEQGYFPEPEPEPKGKGAVGNSPFVKRTLG